MESFTKWFETTPYAVPVVAIILFIVLVVIAKIIKAIREMPLRALYEAADRLRLDVVDRPSMSGGTIPRLSGNYDGRNLEIYGYRRFERGINAIFLRIKMAHKAYIVKRVVIEYDTMASPPEIKMSIDGNPAQKEDLFKLKILDDKSLDDLKAFFQTYSLGSSKLPSYLTFETTDVSFDRDPSMMGSADQIVACVAQLNDFIKYIEEQKK